jgi:hypothetical protein
MDYFDEKLSNLFRFLVIKVRSGVIKSDLVKSSGSTTLIHKGFSHAKGFDHQKTL